MATQWTTFPIKFEGGLTTNLGRLEQGLQAPGSATILQNYEPAVQGGYSRVLGYEKFSPVVLPGTGNVLSTIAVGTNEVLALRDSVYYWGNGLGWTAKATLPLTNVLRTTHISFNFDGTLKTVIVDGTNAPLLFNHDTDTLSYFVGAPAEVVGASRVTVFKNHVFYANGPLLTFSAPYEEGEFTPAKGAGVINVGNDITGIVVFREQLIIFSLNSIYRLGGNSIDDFILQSITANTGCLCGHTIQEIGGDLIYLGPDGLRYLSASERENDFGLVRASEKIQREIISVVNTNCFYSSVTVAEKNQYRLFNFVDNISDTDTEAFLGTKYSNQTADNISWAKLKGFKVYSMSKFQDRDTEFMVFGNSTGYIYRLEIGSSLDGKDIESIFETPYMPLNDPKVRKTVYKHTLYARPSGTLNITCNLKFDYAQPSSSQSPAFPITGGGSSAVYGSVGSVYGAAVYGANTEEQYYNNTIGSGFVVAIRYYNKSTNPAYNLNFATLEFRQNERR